MLSTDRDDGRTRSKRTSQMEALLCLLLLSFVHMAGSTCGTTPSPDGESMCLSLAYSGSVDPPGCESHSCLFERTTYFESYVCSGGTNGNTIVQVFENPLPDSVVLLSFSMTLWGRFQCDAAGPTTVGVVTFNNEFYTAGPVSTPTIGCSCPNCATSFAIPPNSAGGIPTSYKYGVNENNTMVLRVLEGAVCVSSLDILMTYGPSPPDISQLTPQSGSVDAGTIVTITGQKFSSSAQLICAFGSIFTVATYISEDMITCSTPLDLLGTVNVSVSENNLTWSETLAFYFGRMFVRFSSLSHANSLIFPLRIFLLLSRLTRCVAL